MTADGGVIEQAQMAVDQFVYVLGRAALEALLELSAQQIAGPCHQGKPVGEMRRHGTQQGTVRLSTRELMVRKPCAPGSRRSSTPIISYSAAVITRSKMSWATCRKSLRTRSKRW